MANRRHWAAGAGVGVASAALLMTSLTTTALGSVFDGPGSPGDSPTATSGATADADGAFASSASGGDEAAAGDSATSGDSLTVPYFGAFTDSGAEGVRNLAGLSRWLGGTPVRVGHTYLPGGTWEDIEGDQDLLQPWADWRRADSRRLFVLNVPMQARNEQHLDDGEVRELIRQGAAGAFDAHFTRLAEHLVELGVPDTVIVLGWEMNGTTYTHRCAPDPDDWKTYWNRVVAAMRAVHGQRFRFDFAPSRGRDDIGWTRCYPGDGSVDIIGMDSYDQPPGEDFDEQISQPYGLQAQVDFAARHGKAISYPEWGLFRNGDDPEYMGRMLRWMTRHGALYQTVTDYCPHGVWQCDENPRSSSVFRTLLSAPAPGPTATPGPSASPSPSGAASPSPAPSILPTTSASPTPTTSSSPPPSPSASASPVPTATATPTATSAPHTPASTSAPTFLPTSTPTRGTPSPAPTATPTASTVATPTAAPTTAGVTSAPSGTSASPTSTATATRTPASTVSTAP